jgi:histone deacetylase 6
MRRKLGNLVRSSEDSLDRMLDEHFGDVTDLLGEKRKEWEEEFGRTSEGEGSAAGLRSPPLQGGRGAGVGEVMKSPKGPPLGLFSVSAHSPRSPRSPLKRTF